jgi:hypothetical protein
VDPEDNWVKTKTGNLPVSRILLVVDVRREMQIIPIHRAFRYQSPDDKIVDGVEFQIPRVDAATGRSLQILLQNGPDHGMRATFRLCDDESAS